MPSRTDRRPVLVVDDDPAFRRLVVFTLRDLGFETIEASTAREAWKRAGRVAAIVSDYSMPGATGLELLTRLRAKGSSVPFVLTSSLFPSGVRAAAAAADAAAVDKSRLIETLPAVLPAPAVAA